MVLDLKTFPKIGMGYSCTICKTPGWMVQKISVVSVKTGKRWLGSHNLFPENFVYKLVYSYLNDLRVLHKTRTHSTHAIIFVRNISPRGGLVGYWQFVCLFVCFCCCLFVCFFMFLFFWRGY